MKLEQLLLYLFICFVLYYFMIFWGIYLVNNGFFNIQESFQPNVDLPLTTRYSCSNFCGPNSQCAFTREQCSSDIDCTGCKPNINKNPTYKTKDVPGENDAGKLTFSQTPQYSVLTTDIGTKASLYNKLSASVPQVYLGLDQWTKSANQGMTYFFKNQTDNGIELGYDFEFEPKYPKTESITGIFVDTGPLPANIGQFSE